MKNKEIVWLVVAILVIAVIVGVVYYELNKEQLPPSPINMADNQVEILVGTEKTGVVLAPKTEAGLSYQQVVDKYKGYRFQFNDQCATIPSTQTFKNGTRVMFDNRTAEQKTIALDGKGYTIGSYGFIILPLSARTLPHTIKVDCDQQYNTAQIYLQK
ncbi:MAG: hypothetical protein WCT37_02810 [Patescibacteria group bacterium]|jgi:hypothetical protein